MIIPVAKNLKHSNKANPSDPSLPQHGTPISEAVNFYSLEENFLSELTDYSNETGSKPVVAELRATAGRARVVAECTCTKAFNCTSEGSVYAEVNFQVNDVPDAGDVLVSFRNGFGENNIFWRFKLRNKKSVHVINDLLRLKELTFKIITLIIMHTLVDTISEYDRYFTSYNERPVLTR